VAPRAPTTTAVPVIPATALEIAAAPPPLPEDPADPVEPDPVDPEALMGPLMELGDLEGEGTTTVPLLLSTKIGGFKLDENPPEAFAETIGPANPREVMKD